jgi:hypothetical protein
MSWHDAHMAEIVNLRRVKKARARAEADAEAAANRALHGRTRMEREATETDMVRQTKILDGARLVRDGELRE